MIVVLATSELPIAFLITASFNAKPFSHPFAAPTTLIYLFLKYSTGASSEKLF